MTPTKEYLLSKCHINQMTGCWIWTGRKRNQYGHGAMSVNNKEATISRVAYELWMGPIPPKICVCHKCDNPACFNPDHLFLGTHKDNTQDCIRKGRFVTPKRKLTEEQANEIRDSAESDSLLSKKFCVNRKTVYRIRQGQSYRTPPCQTHASCYDH